MLKTIVDIVTEARASVMRARKAAVIEGIQPTQRLGIGGTKLYDAEAAARIRCRLENPRPSGRPPLQKQA
jgi:hypothetical protein